MKYKPNSDKRFFCCLLIIYFFIISTSIEATSCTLNHLQETEGEPYCDKTTDLSKTVNSPEISKLSWCPLRILETHFLNIILEFSDENIEPFKGEIVNDTCSYKNTESPNKMEYIFVTNTHSKNCTQTRSFFHDLLSFKKTTSSFTDDILKLLAFNLVKNKCEKIVHYHNEHNLRINEQPLAGLYDKDSIFFVDYGDFATTKMVFTHEVTHLVLDTLFQNKEKPFDKANPVLKKDYISAKTKVFQNLAKKLGIQDNNFLETENLFSTSNDELILDLIWVTFAKNPKNIPNHILQKVEHKYFSNENIFDKKNYKNLLENKLKKIISEREISITDQEKLNCFRSLLSHHSLDDLLELDSNYFSKTNDILTILKTKSALDLIWTTEMIKDVGLEKTPKYILRQIESKYFNNESIFDNDNCVSLLETKLQEIATKLNLSPYDMAILFAFSIRLYSHSIYDMDAELILLIPELIAFGISEKKVEEYFSPLMEYWNTAIHKHAKDASLAINQKNAGAFKMQQTP